MKIKIPHLLLGILLGLSIFCGRLSASTRIHADGAAFLRGAGLSQVDLVFQIVHDPVEKIISTDWIVGLQLNIYKNDSLWTSKTWDNTVRMDSSAKAGSVLKYVGKIAFQAPMGAYSVQMTAEDKTFKGETDSCRLALIVQSDHSNQARISDVVLASSIREAGARDEQNPFFKNNLIVLPSPERKYPHGTSDLYYYAELYHLLSNPFQGDYLFQSTITRMDGSTILRSGIQKYPRDAVQDAMAVYEQLQIANVDSGSYQLQIALYDSSGRMLAHQSKVFKISRPDAKEKGGENSVVSDGMFLQSSFAKLSGESLEEEMACLKMVLSSSEQSIVKKLENDDAKRQFLHRYWLSKDEMQASAENTNYIQYKKRIADANFNFKAFNRKGWKTDRGRVYILYGPPNEIERFPSSPDQIPYEIWSYDNIEGGVIFVFADLQGDKTFSLLHSTKKGEAYYPNYITLIQR